ncbi:MAG: hypothetical protein JF606_11770 [Burkholderiales bacterium]|jgi:hypothetical protein|nr:hypothetical protein [Burkholderiales bacterium]
MKQPFRFWMTGSVAVVMAALGIGRSAVAHERHPLSQSSRFRVLETVERIEASAQRHGLSVFTRVGSEGGVGREEFMRIVFASSVGGTPVLMEGPESHPELPLTVAVRAHPTGGAEVFFAGVDWDDLPANVARDLTELPILVADALR